MTQPQIDMLQNSRNWMNSAKARLLHATTGQWFDNTQRQQIVNTMQELAAAKAQALAKPTPAPTGGGGGGPAGKPVFSGGKIIGYTTDGKTMTPVGP
jgi:hypothetical protein